MRPTFGTWTTVGRRNRYQHDRVLATASYHGFVFGVFDGHAPPVMGQLGHVVAHHLYSRFVPLLEQYAIWRMEPRMEPDASIDAGMVHTLREVVGRLEREVWERRADVEVRGVYGGSTLCVVVLRGSVLYTVNVGDSRAVVGVVGRGGGGKYGALLRSHALTRDHVGSDQEEVRRVEEEGGAIKNGRVNGVMAMTRAIGDFEMKDGKGVTAEPDVGVRWIAGDEVFIVLATDGVWGKAGTDAVVLAGEQGMIVGWGEEQIAKGVGQYAIGEGSADNVSVVFVRLRDLPEREEGGWRKWRKAMAAGRETGEDGEDGSSGDRGGLSVRKWRRKILSGERGGSVGEGREEHATGGGEGLRARLGLRKGGKRTVDEGEEAA